MGDRIGDGFSERLQLIGKFRQFSVLQQCGSVV
jgi:hypothetical protein